MIIRRSWCGSRNTCCVCVGGGGGVRMTGGILTLFETNKNSVRQLDFLFFVFVKPELTLFEEIFENAVRKYFYFKFTIC